MEEKRDYARLLAGYRTAILTTLGAEGHFHSRPMAMRQQVRGEEIWFATSAGSKKVLDLEHEARCALTFFEPGGPEALSISGTGEVIRDRKLLHELWDASWRRWFPGGPDSKDVVLVRVIPEYVERHDASGTTEVLFTGRRRG
jgi:general stress protein 26